MKYKSILAWVFAFIFMAGVAVYQRLTGPTHPARGSVEISDTKIKFALPRSFGGPGDAEIVLEEIDKSVNGELKYMRFKSHDEPTIQPMKREGDKLIGYLPHLPPAGKYVYEIFLEKNGDKKMITEEPVILRFKGAVPDFFLIPHIIAMFLAMVFSTRAAISGIFKWDNTYKLTLWTIIFLAIGGLFLGPFVQYYAFGDFWTGWPLAKGEFNLFKFGDLTDNKTLAAFVAWAIAFWRLKINHKDTKWAWIAALVLFAVYMIPHSVLGSEIDFRELDGKM